MKLKMLNIVPETTQLGWEFPHYFEPKNETKSIKKTNTQKTHNCTNKQAGVFVSMTYNSSSSVVAARLNAQNDQIIG